MSTFSLMHLFFFLRKVLFLKIIANGMVICGVTESFVGKNIVEEVTRYLRSLFLDHIFRWRSYYDLEFKYSTADLSFQKFKEITIFLLIQRILYDFLEAQLSLFNCCLVINAVLNLNMYLLRYKIYSKKTTFKYSVICMHYQNREILSDKNTILN